MIGPDAKDMRTYLYSLIDWSDADSVLDLGCGTGYDLNEIAKLTKSDTILVGLDSWAPSVEQAMSDVQKDPRCSFLAHNIELALPFPDNNFDFVYSNNLLECIQDKTAFLREVNRILKPGGQFLCAHFDWDSQVINGTNKELIRKAVHAFADWQQPWMQTHDGWTGRRLWATVQGSGLFDGAMFSYVLTNTRYEAPFYGWARIQDFAQLAKHGLLDPVQYQELLEDIETLSAQNQYFYSITTYAYRGRKASLK